jgi:hypothetical protein
MWAPPTSKDQTLATKLATEEEYDNYQGGVHAYDTDAGAPPVAQTTKDDGQDYDVKTDGTHEDAAYDMDGIHRYDVTTGDLIPPGYIKYKQIKYDMSDFLGSCVRLYQDLTNTGNVPFKPALTPFIDETGDDYGLGAGLTEDAEDGEPEKHAYVDMERTLQELAQNACVGFERSGYFTYGYNFDDVEDCHAARYRDLDRRRLPYSENRTEGAVPLEFVRIPRVGRISISATGSGISKPTMTETLQAGLSLRSLETVTINQGESVILTTGLCLCSFRGGKVRSTQSVLGPGATGEIRDAPPY